MEITRDVKTKFNYSDNRLLFVKDFISKKSKYYDDFFPLYKLITT